MRYTRQTEDLAEAQHVAAVLSEYGELQRFEHEVNGSIDLDALVMDLSKGVQVSESPEVSYDASDLVSMAEDHGIGKKILINEIASEMHGCVFHLPDFERSDFGEIPETKINKAIRTSLIELIDEEWESSDSAEEVAERDLTLDGEERTDVADLSDAETDVDQAIKKVLEDPVDPGQVRTGSSGQRGITKDWNGVDQGVRKDQVVRFFENNPDTWLSTRDFTAAVPELDEEDADDRSIASSALSNAFKRDNLSLEKRRVQSGARPTNEYRLNVETEIGDEEEVEEAESVDLPDYIDPKAIGEPTDTDHRMHKGTQQMKLLALLAKYVEGDSEGKWFSVDTLVDRTVLSKSQATGSLWHLREKEVAVSQNTDSGQQWTTTTRGLWELKEADAWA